MGLDMFLTARINAEQDSTLCKVIEEYATPEHMEYVNNPESGGAYVSGWSWPAHDDGTGGKQPETLYVKLCEELGFECHPGSPHLYVNVRPEGGYVVEPCVMYWRKANAIHQWFVLQVQDGEDDCGEYRVHPEVLMDLLERCEKVLADHSLAAIHLPTTAGFFFGSTEYDDWYFSDLEETVKGIKALPLVGGGLQFYYRASW